MAEKKGASKLYGKSPKIENEPVDAVGDTDTSGHSEKAREKAAEPPKTEGTMDKGGNAKGDVMAGTNGIETHHHHERNEMHGRHMHEHMTMHHRHQHEHMMGMADHERHHKERQSMHTRHEREAKEMSDRHMGGEGPTGGMVEKEVGKAGTEK